MWLLWFQAEVATAVTLFFLPTWLISYNTHSSPSWRCSLYPGPFLDNQHWSRKEHFVPQKTWDIELKWNLGFKIIMVRVAAILEPMTDGNYITCSNCGNRVMVLCTVAINSRKSSYPVNQENMAPVATAAYWEKWEYAISSTETVWLCFGENQSSLYILLARELQMWKASAHLHACRMRFRHVEWWVLWVENIKATTYSIHANFILITTWVLRIKN